MVSDVHLRGDGDPHQAAFIEFLGDVVAPARDATFVVAGDLVHFWYGRPGAVPRRWARLIDALVSLPRVLWIEGNHDLRLDRVLPPGIDLRVGPQTFAVGSRRVLIAHGDGLGPGGALHRAFLSLLRWRGTEWVAGLLGPRATERIGLGAADRKGAEPYDGREEGWLTAARTYAASEVAQGATDVVLGHGHWLGQWDGRLTCPGDWRKDRAWIEITAAGPSIHRWSQRAAPPPGDPGESEGA